MIYKVSALSYSNSLPFVFGLQNYNFSPEKIELTLGNPTLVASNLISNKAHIGLVPIATLPLLPDYKIITKYCISSSGPVNSVMLLSNSSLSKIKRIYLDYQSQTSVILIQIIAKIFWHIDFQFVFAEPGYENNQIAEDEGIILIGDRALQKSGNFSYQTDLSEQWQYYTQLPFVFAVWVARRDIPGYFCEQLEKSLSYGVSNIDQVIKSQPADYLSNLQYNLYDYLTKSIKYQLNEEKMKVIDLFLQLAKQFRNSRPEIKSGNLEFSASETKF